MLAIKVVSGPQAGIVFRLVEGANTFGRSPECTHQLSGNGISKTHAQIEIAGEKLIVKDLDSRNGTYVNGIQVRKKTLQLGDKLSFHDIMLEVVDANEIGANVPQTFPMPQQGHYPAPQGMPPQYPHYPQQHHAGPAVDYGTQPSYQPQMSQDQELYDEPGSGEKLNEVLEAIETYIEEVVLPGVYKLPQSLDFKWVLGIVMAGFIILVTSLSTIPLLRILKTSVERESQEHALTIAKTLAEVNLPALSQGLNTAISVAIALKRPGVKGALVISDVDGSILAPAAKVGSYPDIPFVHEARRRGQEAVSQIDSDTVVALAPMELYNAETGARGVTAYSVVIYDMGSLAVDDGKTLSLFIQTLFIALIIGGILFFFLYKMIEYPIKSLNFQLNDALKEGTSQVHVDYEFQELQDLASNISSALSRTGAGDDMSLEKFERDRSLEMGNLVEHIGFASLTVNATDENITAINHLLEERAHMPPAQFLHQSYKTISDQAFKLSIEDLIGRVKANPDQIHSNDLDFGGESFQLSAQAFFGASEISYYLFVLLPAYDGGYEE